MKLTKEQIQDIEGYLTRKGVKYIDLRFEILDHISTDIETIMDENQLGFNEAFEEVKNKWRKSLNNTFSFWFGMAYSGPSLLIKRCSKTYRSMFFKSVCFILFFSLMFYFFSKQSNNEHLILNEIFYYSTIILVPMYLVLFIYWVVKIKKTDFKSSFSFLFKTQFVSNLLLLVIVFPKYFENDIHNFDTVDFVVLLYLIMIPIYTYTFYKNHLKVVSSYKKYQLQ